MSSAFVARLAKSDPDPGSEYPWHHLISPLIIFGMCSFFCSSEPYSSNTGASIHIPKLSKGCFAPIPNSSSLRTFTSSFVRPPPPYSFGTVGIVHPFSPILSNHSLDSGFLYSAFLPPHTSSTGILGSAPVLIEGGQFLSSHSLVSCLNLSKLLILFIFGLIRISNIIGAYLNFSSIENIKLINTFFYKLYNARYV